MSAQPPQMPGDEVPLVTLLSDHPISENPDDKSDRLDLHQRLRAHLDTLRHPLTKTPFTMAFYGDWGTGKTSAMRWLHSQISQWNQSEKRKELNASAPKRKHPVYPRITPVWFYPWKYHKREDVWRGLIAEVILASLKVENKDSPDFSQRVLQAAKQFGKFLGHAFLHVVSNLEAEVSVGDGPKLKLDGQVVRDIYDEYNKTIRPHAPFLNEFENELSSWVRNVFDDTNNRLLVFIDDLDRCLPEVALEVLEALKLYLNLPGLIFVAGLDDHVIGPVICHHYSKHGVDAEKARHYLAKIFQVEFRLESSEAKAASFLTDRLAELDRATGGEWTKCLPPGTADEFSQRSAIEAAIGELAASNPREITRLLNSMLVRAVAASGLTGNGGNGPSREELFVQGAQTFLLERFLDENLRPRPSRSPLLNPEFCTWLQKLAQCRIDQPDQPPYSDQSPLEISLGPNISSHFAAVHKEATMHLGGEAFQVLANGPCAWNLLRIPFNPDVAASIASTAPIAGFTAEELTYQRTWTSWQAEINATHDAEIKNELFSQAIAALPTSAPLLGSFARFLSDTRQEHDAAEALHKRAIDADPKSASNLGNYAYFLRNVRKDYDAAGELYLRAIAANPKSAAVLGSYAAFLETIVGDYDSAEDFYKRAIAAHPKHANTLAIYATFLNQVRRNSKEAEAFFKRAINADPDHPNALANYGQFLIGKGSFRKALVYLRNAWRSKRLGSSLRPELAFSLWIGTMMIGLEEQSWERAFKFMVIEGFVRTPWSFETMLAQAKARLSGGDFRYAKALANAFLDEGKVAALDNYSRWRDLEPLAPARVNSDGSIQDD